MKFSLTVKPKYLILITLTLSAILLVITILDIVEGEKDIYEAKKDEASSLLRSVQKAGENVYISSQEVENLIKEKLINSAYFIAGEETRGKLTPQRLRQIEEETGAEHISVYSADKKRELGPDTDLNTEKFLFENFGGEIDSVINGSFDYFVPGIVGSEGNGHFCAVQKRYPPYKGFLTVSISPEKLLDFRKRIGIGNLFRKIADTEEIVYIVIQDEGGIITATSAVDELSSVSGDPFLFSSLKNGQFAYRETNYMGNSIYEAVKPFMVKNEAMGIIRIGLSLKQVDNLIKRTVIRSIAISVLLLLTGGFLLVVIADKQNMSFLKDQYRKIQTYTGNILNNMSEGVIAADSAGKIHLMNPSAERILGFNPGEAIGKYCGEIIKNSDCLIDIAIKKNGPVDYTEILIQTMDGKKLIIGGSADIVRNEDNSINTVVTVIKDVTAMKSAEEAAKRNEKLMAMGELAAGVAHEIKNPLNSIGIMAQRFQKEFLPENDSAEFLQMTRTIKGEVERVGKIINQFLAFAKPQKINLKETDCDEMLKSVYNSFTSQAVKENIAFSFLPGGGIINADYELLKQAVINLVKNAFEAAGQGGRVNIEAARNYDEVCITISDNGPGINDEEKQKIFNLYYTTKPSGSGLGLSIVNRIISEHNGGVLVESAEGEGTKFIIKLPV